MNIWIKSRSDDKVQIEIKIKSRYNRYKDKIESNEVK